MDKKINIAKHAKAFKEWCSKERWKGSHQKGWWINIRSGDMKTTTEIHKLYLK